MTWNNVADFLLRYVSILSSHEIPRQFAWYDALACVTNQYI